jgi:hypothetical protein
VTVYPPSGWGSNSRGILYVSVSVMAVFLFATTAPRVGDLWTTIMIARLVKIINSYPLVVSSADILHLTPIRLAVKSFALYNMLQERVKVIP